MGASFDFRPGSQNHCIMHWGHKIAGRVTSPIAGLGLFGVAVLLHVALALQSQRPLRCMPCAALLGAIGVFVLGWSLLVFLRHRTSPLPGTRPDALVVDGPYRFSRNPMYVAATMLLLSAVFFIGSLPFLIPPMGYFLLMQCVCIPHEERRMNERFGDAYEAYRARVRRWI